MSTLERAIVFAAEAHAGQRDKAGVPYILHPLRVMQLVTTPEARIAAVLHDVVEDSDWSLGALREEGFSDEVLGAVDAVTRREGEEYFDFARRAGEHPIGRQVKLAHLRDNLDLSRIAAPTQQDHERIARYQKALQLLDLSS